jgi:hypothetical protein
MGEMVKRSKMLKEISDIITEHKGCCNDLSLANNILLFIQESGIKPPHHPNRLGEEFKCRGNWNESAYEWEEEDCDIVE